MSYESSAIARADTGADTAKEDIQELAAELDAALRNLRRLLVCNGETMREAEAIKNRLLNVSRILTPEQGAEIGGKLPALLTDQESRVLEQICHGCTNRQIARKLGIAEKTAKNYVQAVFRKLRVHSRTEAAMIAAQHHWYGVPMESGYPHDLSEPPAGGLCQVRYEPGTTGPVSRWSG
jgi:DNA-binding NarL/FixJ family response regulator